MKVYSWQDAEDGALLQKSAICIGGFDGPHIGHQKIFDSIFEWKKNRPDVLAGAVTFRRPPGALMNPKYPGDVSTPKFKLDFFEKRAFDFCLMIDFSEDFSRIEGRAFLDKLRKFCSMQFLAAGSDFRLGRNSDTGVAELSDYAGANGLELKVLDDALIDDVRVSSSLIRGAVQKGDFALAKRLLGFAYRLDGSPFTWKACSSDNGLSLIANGKTAQVLPKAGRHPARVVFAGKESSAFFCAEGQFLRLEFPLGQSRTDVQEIEFL